MILISNASPWWGGDLCGGDRLDRSGGRGPGADRWRIRRRAGRAFESLKFDERDFLRLPVFGDDEVLGGEALDRLAVLVLDTHRLHDEPRGRAKRRLRDGLLRLLLCEPDHTRHREQKRGEENSIHV